MYELVVVRPVLRLAMVSPLELVSPEKALVSPEKALVSPLMLPELELEVLLQEKVKQLQVRLNLEQQFIQAQEQFHELSCQVSYKFVGRLMCDEFGFHRRNTSFAP